MQKGGDAGLSYNIISAITLSENTAFVLLYAEVYVGVNLNHYDLYGAVCTINGTTISVKNQLINEINNTYGTLVKLSNNRVFVVFR